VLSVPDAAPASRSGTLNIAIVVSGANTRPMPRPSSDIEGRNVTQVEPLPATSTAQPVPAA
jgi:hypothetical protein